MKITKITLFALSTLLTLGIGFAQGPGMGPGTGPGTGPGAGYDDYPGWNGHELEHNVVLPQVAVGDNIVTTLIVTNMGGPQRMGWLNDPQDFVTTGSIHFYDQNGDDLSVSIGGVTASEFPFSLDASEVQFLELISTKPGLHVGWLLIEVDDDDESATWGMMDGHAMSRGERVMVTAYYTISGSDGGVATQVAVRPGMFQRGHFFNSMVTAQHQNGINTGVAMVNTSDQNAQIELILRDTIGQVIATQQLELPAGNQKARFIDEFFGAGKVPNGFRGTLEINTNAEGIVSMALLQTQSVLTSIPMHHWGMWSNQ